MNAPPAPLLDWKPPEPPAFGGATFEPKRDGARLNRQAKLVFDAMRDCEWWTLARLAERTGCPEASVSARLRDLRKPRFGGFIIQREHVGDGLHRYRLLMSASGGPA